MTAPACGRRSRIWSKGHGVVRAVSPSRPATGGRRRAAALFRSARRPARRPPTPGTLTIAYNVNLPSFDPTVGLSAVNPTIQSIYQSVFDPYIGQAPDLSFKPGLLTKWGWNADRTKITLELRKGATWHDGSPVTPEDVVWSLQRAADTKRRQSDPVRLVQGRQLQDRRQYHHRRRAGIRADPVQVDGVPHRLRAAEGLLREGRRGRFREGADRLRPVQGRCLRAQCVPAAQGASGLLGPQARLRDRGVQIRHRSDQPRRRDGIRRLGRHLRNSLRGVRPPEGESRGWSARPSRCPTSR